ncbi:MAG: hypothetical protein ACE5IR_22290 [bacterium]
MFSKKNSFILILIWIVLVAAGSFWYLSDARGLEAAHVEETMQRELLLKSQNEIKRMKDVENIHEQLNSSWLSAPKLIVSADEPSFTLSYINWIMSFKNLIIDFDFVLNDKHRTGDYIKFTYTLNGEGRYHDIYKLIWYLTYEPILYKINLLRLRKAASDPDLLKFTMKIQGWTVADESQLNDEFPAFESRTELLASTVTDIFEPRVKPRPVVAKQAKPKKPTLPAKKPGEIDVEKATIKAITNNSVFIKEGKSSLVELKLGASVYLGKLIDIDHKSNEAVFLITKFGKSQQIRLAINQRQ